MSKDSLKWKVDTCLLLEKIANCGLPRTMGVMKVPLNIFKQLIGLVAQRAIIIDDKEMNKLMIRLGLYDCSYTEEGNKYLDS